MTTKVEKFNADLSLCGLSEVMAVDRIKDVVMDKGVEKTNVHALAYILKKLHIPHPYFNRSAENHRAEILKHAALAYPETQLNVLVQSNKLLAAGPASVAPFCEIPSYLDSIFGNVETVISGSLFDVNGVQIYKAFGALPSTGYKVGVSILLSTLFSKGFSVMPMIYEVRCTNGLIDIKEAGADMHLLPDDCIPEAIIESSETMTALTNGRVERYSYLLDRMSQLPAFTADELTDFLTIMDYPKSFIPKAVNLSQAVAEGTLKSEALPSGINNRLDNLSLLTYTAQAFNPFTRTKMESRIFEDLKVMAGPEPNAH